MSTFTVAGLEGITFTAEFDPDENWLTIAGRDRDGELVSKSGISVTPDPIDDIAVTPEIVSTPTASDRVTAAEYVESLAPDLDPANGSGEEGL